MGLGEGGMKRLWRRGGWIADQPPRAINRVCRERFSSPRFSSWPSRSCSPPSAPAPWRP
ncbi:hypothetical protein [Lysobacter gummosus]|uniref:hypothetical protein n=1 Tax=Lysobacter gummosus TaxID=262324 RepID=UPI00364363B3